MSRGEARFFLFIMIVVPVLLTAFWVDALTKYETPRWGDTTVEHVGR